MITCWQGMLYSLPPFLWRRTQRGRCCPDAVAPAVIAARGQHAGRRFIEFFIVNIRNPNTRKAYYRAACEFFDWCDQAQLGLLDIEPVHVAAWDVLDEVEKIGI